MPELAILVIISILCFVGGICLLMFSNGNLGKQPESFLGKFFSAYFGTGLLVVPIKMFLK